VTRWRPYLELFGDTGGGAEISLGAAASLATLGTALAAMPFSTFYVALINSSSYFLITK